MTLILSIFPGIGMADHAFEQEGFCVVRGPDPLWGGDVKRFHPPAGRFDGIIGGDPCQSHSALANLVRAKGLEPKWGDLTGEYQRVIEAAQPRWFLRENVPQAPDLTPDGYRVRSFMLDNSTLDSGDGTGNEQMRRRRFWFGVQQEYGFPPELRQWIDFALFELPDAVLSVGGDHGTSFHGCKRNRDEGSVIETPKHRDLAEMLRLQGFPPDWLDHQPWTMQAKRRMIGNGWALPMGRALARAIRIWIEKENSAA